MNCEMFGSTGVDGHSSLAVATLAEVSDSTCDNMGSVAWRLAAGSSAASGSRRAVMGSREERCLPWTSRPVEERGFPHR